ncbi:MAG: RDD family protein, partial [Patescibacteria group bacterium]
NMNQKAVEYLQKNKEDYTKESLIEQLRNAGYSEEEIEEATTEVFGGGNEASPKKEGDVKTNETKYAGFWIRFVAMFVDGLIVGICSMILTVPLSLIMGTGLGGTIMQQFVLFVIALLYFALMTDKYQATLGKKLLGLEVRDVSMKKAESGKIWTRELISRAFMTIPPLGLLHITVAFTQKKQGLHDMAAKTVVVYKDSNKKMNGCVIAVVIGIVVLVMIAVIGVFSSIVLVSLNSARDKASDASVKAGIASTVPSAIFCMDDGQNLNSPTPGTPICEGSEGNWPILSEGGQWGTMIDGDVSDGGFEYTATYGTVENKVTCTEKGCDFIE